MTPAATSPLDTTEREELLTLIEELGRRYPSMRLGQLIANAAYWANGPTKSAVWDVEDAVLRRAIEDHLQKSASE